ncbi:hypothetical protein ISS37_04180 [candidate division KSB1 bacterium]|nr:hypothetical protein [candidate division KSB1 bacterium]
MKTGRCIEKVLFGGLCLSILWGCTENPFTFSEEDISYGSRQIRGKVILSDGSSPEGVYVWLEGFNIDMRTDEAGQFQVTLPPPASQGTPGGVSGVFDLYFYLANYHLTSSRVIVRNGTFSYGQGDIDKNGELMGPIILTKFLHISTQVTPAFIDTDFDGSVYVKITLQATTDTVTVVFPRLAQDLVGSVFLRKLDSDEVFILTTNSVGYITNSAELIGRSPYNRTMVFAFRSGAYPPGDYEVIPYLLVKHEVIPQGLIESFGENVEELGPNYLKIPFQRQGGRFEIRNY